MTRAFAGIPHAELDPFVHMDEMGAVNYAPGEPRSTDWHPHRGFETVTYIMDGRFQHQDSHGGGGMITDGATQWMTAGSGVLHIETPPAELVVSGGLFHGVQLWVNLPRSQKFADPRYQILEGSDSALVTTPGDLITLTADERQDVETPALEVLLLGGRPLREPVVQYGPFVMNDRAGVIQAFEDFQAGRLGTVPADGIRPYRPTEAELRAAIAKMPHGGEVREG